MNGAEYALIVNVCVALLFAITFAVVRLSYAQQRSAGWFCVTYLFGMLAPLSELGIRFTNHMPLFTATSYASLVASAVSTVVGVAALARLPVPRRAAIALVVLGIACRTAIWNGPRNTLGYGMVFQAPFFTAFLLSTWMATVITRRTRDPIWLTLSVVFAIMTAYFMTKPFFAAAFGSGAVAKDYAKSSYALFSQALGGILIVMSGLVILLMIVRSMLSSSIAEAETDALTNIANRRGFDRRARQIMGHARETGQPLAVVALDLDHFKQVNDEFGHATGDAVLRAFAGSLLTAAPPSALVARLGGEEFAVLLDRTTLRGAILTAEAIRKATTDLGSHLPSLTVSGGIAELKAGDSLDSLLARADDRAYRAKASGRNRIFPAASSVDADYGART